MRRTGRFKSFDGTRVAFRTYRQDGGSTGVPLICFSGIACDEVYWRRLGQDLAASRQVVTWDYPYHGESGPAGDPSEITIPSLARHAAALFDHLEITSAALIGHSMGVQAMLELYGLRPESVRGMVSLAGPYQHVVGHLYGTPLGVVALALLDAVVKVQPALAQRLWKLAVTPALADTIGRAGGLIGPAPTEPMFHYFRHLATLELEPLIAMFKAGQEHTAAQLLDKIDVPFLILHGTLDVMTPFSLAEEMHAKIRDSELIAVEGGAHTLPVEDHDLVLREVSRFLMRKVDAP